MYSWIGISKNVEIDLFFLIQKSRLLGWKELFLKRERQKTYCFVWSCFKLLFAIHQTPSTVLFLTKPFA